MFLIFHLSEKKTAQCVLSRMGIMLFLGGHSHSHSHGLGHDRHDHNHSHAERSGVYEALPSAESTEECSSGIENGLHIC